MNNYQYTIKDNTIRAVGYEKKIAVFDISKWKPENLNYYRTLLAQKRDMDYAKAYLNQMFFGFDTSLVDGALINSAMQLLIKCFTNPSNKGRRRLDYKKVFGTYAKQIGEQDLTSQFAHIYEARRTVISHDQNDFKENMVGLAINRNTGEAEDIAEVTIRTEYLYKQNQEVVLKMVTVVESYLDDQIEQQKKLIIDEYNKCVDKHQLAVMKCENMPMTTSW